MYPGYSAVSRRDGTLHITYMYVYIVEAPSSSVGISTSTSTSTGIAQRSDLCLSGFIAVCTLVGFKLHGVGQHWSDTCVCLYVLCCALAVVSGVRDQESLPATNIAMASYSYSYNYNYNYNHSQRLWVGWSWLGTDG